MLLMFAVGGVEVGWMLALAAVMFVEKAITWGRAVTVAVGLGLAGWGLALLIGAPGVPHPSDRRRSGGSKPRCRSRG
jgi:predicted metal-binding membrane protein